LTRLFLVLLVLSMPVLAQPADPELEQFKLAWQAARQGDRAGFEKIKSRLNSYLLYPYLQYEDFRFRRATVDASEMAAFLDAHSDWAFAPGLRRAWLRSLGEKRRWDDLLSYAAGEQDTEVQCYLAHARIQRSDNDQLLSQAQALWAVGQSQPRACDPVFSWLIREKGITPELAWLRIRKAVEARNPRMLIYLSRFVPAKERIWVERWQQQELQKYSRLDEARRWPDQEKARDITLFGLKYLARRDADRAWKYFGSLDRRMQWGDEARGLILREIALWSAVSLAPDAVSRLHAVPRVAWDDVLLEWWARYALATENWTEAAVAIAAMSERLKSSDRWRYWEARTHIAAGEPEDALGVLRELARETGYYGFLAADYLGGVYSICPESPRIETGDMAEFRKKPVIRRMTALDAAGLKSWVRQEWNLATKQFGPEDLRLAASLAVELNWPDLAILALANSGDKNWFEWRFPLTYLSHVSDQARRRGLDPAWVMGVMRSESAMAEDAVSPAGARGLMQVSPGTAAQVATRNGYTYQGEEQLLKAEDNIVFGTTFLRELMDRFGNNPVLVLGAYNAGPAAVDRWLKAVPVRDPAIWIETLPYRETREYIPRVLAFSTIYDWRLNNPVKRISSRMPELNSGILNKAPGAGAEAQVQCPDPSATEQSGR